MKNVLLLLLVSICGPAFGQWSPLVPALKSSPDSVIRVYQAPTGVNESLPAIFLNGKLVGQSILNRMTPDVIESFNVEKGRIEIDGIKYVGKVIVTTKPVYQPIEITLTALKDKYTDLSGKPALFMIDGTLIQADYGRYSVDEKTLSYIVVDKLRENREGVEIALIKVVTKKGKSEEIFMVRGTSR